MFFASRCLVRRLYKYNAFRLFLYRDTPTHALAHLPLPKKLFLNMQRYFLPLGSFLLLLVSVLFAACGNTKEPMEPAAKKYSAYDTAAVHLALMPTADCLPFFYAQETGIYRQLGLRLQIHTYNSQLDCDTALLGGYMDGGYADLQRLEEGRGQKKCLTPLTQGTDAWSLFVGGTLRVRDASKLAGRIVAISRESTEKAFCEKLIAGAKLKADAVYLTQINDVKLRAHMMANRQIDAAFLRWPFTSLALASGDKILASQPSTARNSALVKSSLCKHVHLNEASLSLLKKGYAMALDSMRIYHTPSTDKTRKAETDKVTALLQKIYGLDASVADTIKLRKGGFFTEK